MLLYIVVGLFLATIVCHIFILVSLKKMFDYLKDGQHRVEDSIRSEFLANRKELTDASKSLREEMSQNIQGHNNAISISFESLAKNQRESFCLFEERFMKISDIYIKAQESLKTTIDKGLKNIQEDNKVQLEEMRLIVDEKLQGTLEKRLSESFAQVSGRLQEVYKSMGEMKALANNVGDLKRVLTNVKIRGTWGEFQLGNILEEMLSPDQYEKNVSVKKGTGETVEYAVKLPGQGKGEYVYLPIDSKFPQEDYQKLSIAQEEADGEMFKQASSKLEKVVKKEARTIREKYIFPPRTTDFAVMFLPTEGLYAEILRRPGLTDSLQRDHRVIVSGPTTLAALLNSLAVGFRTLMIQRRSSDIEKLLGAVRVQFGMFSGLLENVQKKLDDASTVMEKASKKSKIIERKLVDVHELPDHEAKELLPKI